jgi:lysozyme family protein
MQADCSECVERILRSEGSEYTDGVHPYDPGGPTRWGITIADARMYWKSDATPDDVRNLPRTAAVGIYRTKYWVRVAGDQLPAGVDYAVVDYEVNSGWGRAGRVLRRVLGLPDTTWQVTPEVLDALDRVDPKDVIRSLCDERMQFLQTLAIWPDYRNGWSARVASVRSTSLHMAEGGQEANRPPVPTMPRHPRGTVPTPDTGRTIRNGGGTVAVGGAGLGAWLQAHPADVLVGVVVAVAAVAAFAVWRRGRAEAAQLAPTPGLVVVRPQLGVVR